MASVVSHFKYRRSVIVPTLRVGTQPWPLCGDVGEAKIYLPEPDAERPKTRSHAERGSDKMFLPASAAG